MFFAVWWIHDGVCIGPYRRHKPSLYVRNHADCCLPVLNRIRPVVLTINWMGYIDLIKNW